MAELSEEEKEILDLLLKSHHQWHPNKKADAWVSSAMVFLRKIKEENDD